MATSGTLYLQTAYQFDKPHRAIHGTRQENFTESILHGKLFELKTHINLYLASELS
jgi:hypothetical protein